MAKIIPDQNTSDRSGLPWVMQKTVRKALRYLALNENSVAGRDFRVGRGVVISSPHGLQIGNSVAIGPWTTIQVDGSIGDYTLIGMSVQICGRHDHAIEELGVPIKDSTWVGDRPGLPSDTITIGRDVWIGGHSTILSGISIGDGCVVGAGSIVSRSLEPFSIAVGVPARVVGRRFESEEQREEHLRLLSLRAGAAKQSSQIKYQSPSSQIRRGHEVSHPVDI